MQNVNAAMKKLIGKKVLLHKTIHQQKQQMLKSRLSATTIGIKMTLSPLDESVIAAENKKKLNIKANKLLQIYYSYSRHPNI